MFGAFFGPGPDAGGTFEAKYRVFPVSFIDKPQLEYGDKVVLPPSALNRLTQLHIQYPMVFEIRNPKFPKTSHCGVMEFCAEEGTCFLPYWMMQNLLLSEGDLIHFKSAVLFKGKFVKIQPHTKDFLDISDPKAVLETSLRCAGACAAPGARRALTCAAHACLTVAPSRAGPRLPSSGACSAKPPVLARRHYSCLTEGDTVVIQYNGKNFYIDIKECRPQRAVSIIETDCEVDFEAPKDYVEPKPSPKAAQAGPSGAAGPGQVVSGGGGRRVGLKRPDPPQEDGKTAAAEAASTFRPFAGGGYKLSSGRPVEGVPSDKASVASTSRSQSMWGMERAEPGKAPELGTSPSITGRLMGAKGERLGTAGGGQAPAAAPKDGDGKEGKDGKEDDGQKFEAFKGKSFKLR